MPEITGLITNLEAITKTAKNNQLENEFFREFLRDQEEELVDKVIHDLNKSVSSQIDCTSCGNCCRAFMINVTKDEAEKVAERRNMSVLEFKKQYLEESSGGQMIVNTIPCHFLEVNKCGIYTDRFLECREFPHLHRTRVKERLFGLLMYYGTCPIIFNVIEEAKQVLGFKD
ncbi:MAG: YkgJ family cysteine cluster protein [Chitinophagaceae bacterium]